MRRTGELAKPALVLIKAVRYYEQLDLLTPQCQTRGYRDYDESHLRLVGENRDLAANGIPPGRARPRR
jgi:DNA-binding transcriptional MerR regulator